MTYGIATGTILRPLGSDMDPTILEWIDLDLAATKQIIVGLSNDEVINNCDSAVEMWSMLCTIHKPTHIQLSQVFICILWQKQATEDTDITDHLNELTHMHNLIAIQGKHVSDTNFKDIMIETLPHLWHPKVQYLW